MEFRTVLDVFRADTARSRPRHLVNASLEGERVLSADEFRASTVRLAQGLAKLGVKRGDRVMLLAENRPEWHVADLAVLGLGATDVPIYPTLLPAQIAYQVNDSGAVAAIVDRPEQLAKLLAIRSGCPTLKHLIVLDGPAEGALSVSDVIASAGSDAEGAFWDAAAKVEPGDLMTIIYTSGTTGEPKGVMLTHDNLVQNARAALPKVRIGPDDVALEFLPLCHSFERAMGYAYMWCSAVRVYCSVYQVADLVARVAPTVFAGVPRFYEKVHAKIHERVAAAPPVRRRLFTWAVETGGRMSAKRIASETPGIPLSLSHALADRLVLSKVRLALGGRVRFCCSGGAPLPLFVNEFFHAIGVPIVEGYGLTETSPIISLNSPAPGLTRLGSVGKVLENLDVRIASDGEITVKGPSVMKGYWNKPQATAEVFDADGYFLTGDVGELDAQGFLRITDRKKDLIITAGGKNVAPAPIESELKRSPYVDNAVVVGDRRAYLVALLSPNFAELERLAREKGLPTTDPATLVGHPAILEEVGKHVEAVNLGLPRYEQIRKFRLLPVTLSMETGHLTPTLKVKRRVVEKEFARALEELYAGGAVRE